MNSILSRCSILLALYQTNLITAHNYYLCFVIFFYLFDLLIPSPRFTHFFFSFSCLLSPVFSEFTRVCLMSHSEDSVHCYLKKPFLVSHTGQVLQYKLFLWGYPSKFRAGLSLLNFIDLTITSASVPVNKNLK